MKQGYARRESIYRTCFNEVHSLGVFGVSVSSLVQYITNHRSIAVSIAICLGKVDVVFSYTRYQPPIVSVAYLIACARLGVEHLRIYLVALNELVLYLFPVLFIQEITAIVVIVFLYIGASYTTGRRDNLLS